MLCCNLQILDSLKPAYDRYEDPSKVLKSMWFNRQDPNSLILHTRLIFFKSRKRNEWLSILVSVCVCRPEFVLQISKVTLL